MLQSWCEQPVPGAWQAWRGRRTQACSGVGGREGGREGSRERLNMRDGVAGEKRAPEAEREAEGETEGEAEDEVEVEGEPARRKGGEKGKRRTPLLRCKHGASTDRMLAYAHSHVHALTCQRRFPAPPLHTIAVRVACRMQHGASRAVRGACVEERMVQRDTYTPCKHVTSHQAIPHQACNVTPGTHRHTKQCHTKHAMSHRQCHTKQCHTKQCRTKHAMSHRQCHTKRAMSHQARNVTPSKSHQACNVTPSTQCHTANVTQSTQCRTKHAISHRQCHTKRAMSHQARNVTPHMSHKARNVTQCMPPPASTCVSKAPSLTHDKAKRSQGRGRGRQQGTRQSGAHCPSAPFVEPRPPPRRARSALYSQHCLMT